MNNHHTTFLYCYFITTNHSCDEMVGFNFWSYFFVHAVLTSLCCKIDFLYTRFTLTSAGQVLLCGSPFNILLDHLLFHSYGTPWPKVALVGWLQRFYFYQQYFFLSQIYELGSLLEIHNNNNCGKGSFQPDLIVFSSKSDLFCSPKRLDALALRFKYHIDYFISHRRRRTSYSIEHSAILSVTFYFPTTTRMSI